MQEITEEDAIAEGVAAQHIHGGMWETAYSQFSSEWDRINPKHPWAANPLVYPIRFRRLEGK